MENPVIENQIVEDTNDATPKNIIPYKDIRKIINDDTPTEPPETTGDKVACPDCGKLVTKKVLKYSHKPQCRKTLIQTKEIIDEIKVEKPKAHRYSHINIF